MNKDQVLESGKEKSNKNELLKCVLKQYFIFNVHAEIQQFSY